MSLVISLEAHIREVGILVSNGEETILRLRNNECISMRINHINILWLSMTLTAQNNKLYFTSDSLKPSKMNH